MVFSTHASRPHYELDKLSNGSCNTSIDRKTYRSHKLLYKALCIEEHNYLMVAQILRLRITNKKEVLVIVKTSTSLSFSNLCLELQVRGELAPTLDTWHSLVIC